MALKQSAWATQARTTATAGNAGVEVVQCFEFALPAAALVAGDIIELGILPAYNSISDAIMLNDATATGMTLDIGLMSGMVGDNDPARTSGAEVFAAVGASVTRATLLTAFTIPASDKDRSIGAKVVAAGTPTAGAKVRLMLKYRAT